MTQTLQKTSLSLAAAGYTAMSFISSAFAQGTDDFAGEVPDVGGLPDATSPDEVKDIVVNILEAVLNFLALVAIVVVVIAGIRLIVSQGDEGARDTAKKTIFYALIGLVIVLFARVIVSLVTVYLFQEVQAS
jgi:hypothetical protein